MSLNHFARAGNDFSVVAQTAFGAIAFDTFANGGAQPTSIDMVTFTDMGGGSTAENTAMIAYSESTDANNRYICGVTVDPAAAAPTNYTCSPRLPIQNNGEVIEIKFADVDGDGLDDMFVLSYDSTAPAGDRNNIYIFENKYDTFPGLYQNLDLIRLKSDSALMDFVIRDLNDDGRLDILANDIEADLDKLYRDPSDTDGSSENIVSGYTIYHLL